VHARSNKRMQLTKLRAAPERRAEVPPCAPAGQSDGGTASQLIRSVGRTHLGWRVSGTRHARFGAASLNGIILVVAMLLCASSAEAKRPAGWKPQLQTWFSYGVRWTSPQEGAVSLTAMRAWEGDEGWVNGWFLQAEPGLAGGKLSVGYGLLAPSERTWLPPEFAAGIKASVLRTWGTPSDVPGATTLLGPELDITVFRVKASVGWLGKVGGPPDAPSGVFTWGLGVGF
jgi:hypothetical protein